MTELPLQGVGVLVTRAQSQAADLVCAIQDAGGTAHCFPAIEILPCEESAIRQDIAGLQAPDIVIFVSPNAVEYGLRYASGAAIAAIGPATANAINAAGSAVAIQADTGYDSESLLAESAFLDVADTNITIIRGPDGRELLADTLRARGASVSYLSVYKRGRPEVSPDLLAKTEAAWRSGAIDIVTVMSVATLENLLLLLPDWCLRQVEITPLVTPAARVIKEALKRFPVSRPVLASGPDATAMVQAIIATHETGQAT